MTTAPSIGIIGGTGQLGSAIAHGLLRSAFTTPERLWISSRSGNTAGFEETPGIQFTTCNQDLVDACGVVMLSVPPRFTPTVGIIAEDRLVISVMAGVTMEQIRQQTRARRIVRAMSNPAAEIGRAYSPWCASTDVTDDDREWTRKMFEACGKTDEVPDEDQVDHFTAITGPVPGFVAYYADCMVAYALKNGISPEIADRAVRQLFYASGAVLAESEATPADHVRHMMAYAGTTAAGLQAMQDSPLATSIEKGLEAAYQKAKCIA